MTDTGQVPGEGLPESAGMVEQPGVHAHGAYTYLSETTAEDEDLLLLPGAQSPWGNEVAPPAPEPVVEAVHEPGPHETAGRDSGSVDLGGVRLPNPTPASSPVTPRRPLHLGPPIPDASASPVRSLADRGPAGAPVRQAGTPTAGPEYFDAPQLREMPPQGAAPWGPQAQAAVQAGVPVNTGAPAAETVVPAAEPSAEPVAAAQAVMAPMATETAPVAQNGDIGVAYGPEGGHVPVGVSATEGGQAAGAAAGAGGPVAGDGHVAPGGFPAAGGGHGAPGEFAADGAQAAPVGAAVDGGHLAPAGATQDVEQGAVPPVAPDAEQDELVGSAPEAAQTPGAAVAPEGGQPDAAVPGVEAVPAPGPAPEAVSAPAAAPAPEAGQVPEAAHAPEGTPTVEGAPVAEGLTPAAGPLAEEPASEGAPIAEPVMSPSAEAVTPEGAPITEVAAPGSGQPAAAVAPEAPQVTEAVAPESEQSPEMVAAAAGQFAEAVAHETGQFPEAVADQAGQFPETIEPGAAQLPEAAAHTTEQAPEAIAPEAAQAPATVAPDAGQAAHAADLAAPQPVVLEPAQAVAVEPAQAAEAPAPGTAEAVVAAPFPAAPDPAQPVAPAGDATAAPEPSPHLVAAEHALQDQSGRPVQTAPDAPTPAPEAEVQPEAAAVADPAAPAVSPVPTAPATDQTAEAGSPTDQAHPAAPLAPEPAVVSAEALPGLPTDEAADPGRPGPGTETPQPLAAEPADPQPDASVGQFILVEGSVPTTPHLAPTPPHALTLPPEEEQAPEPIVKVPAPREADPDLVQHAEDLDTRAADQEEESTAAVEEVRQSTGPAAPAYDDAEREAVMKVMRERRDIRNGFRSDPIPHEVLLRVLEAAHTAPSVGHSQPWDFVVIRSADTRRSMHELAMRQRDAYAKSLPKGRAKQFKELKIEAILDTPVNIVVTADPTRGGRHTLGRHTQPQMAPYSAALAVENLWLAARAEGLGVGWVSFFDEREMVRALGLPEHLEVIAYLCVGYVDEFPDEPELMQAGWSKRRPLSWVVHEETYGRRALPGEEPHDLLAETVAQIRPLDAKALGEAWERQKRMTKPAGALGMLEIISAQLSGLSRQCPPPIPEPAAVAIFAGDHGVHAQGVTPWPQEVTAQMVANFLGGGAVCNAFAGQVGAEVCVVDVGVAADLPATPGLLPRKVRAGTSDMTTGPAMSREEAKQAIEVGIETARDLVAAGNKALLTGEMGIANTTASAALISVFTDTDPAEVTGRGTGINDETLARKTEVVRRAIEVHQPDPADPIGVLAAIGGFEHAAMVGLLLGGASLRTPVILDGVSAGAAALVARAIAPEVLAACIAGHRSAEPGHVAALNKLGLRPLVDLDLRLGEGTGALLALPLVQSTARAMHEVATFDSAGVTEK
ncbi:nicotinate-nucleotide--dimethylbenzimidazole phosphoribosyltransferase [Streptomyces sp. TLI_185]|uniref:nicotinate-nucleotide--dimethylbenzimidazole phosphoribosyltransferase n=1 Tax=Streptomyces sp. TLI_185 TaxID=2485151 RepID=UPI000F5174D6|nr:nicotinate-nucleotide--dimethylbenzimidazole phosphoribosyltransferase [Streptomyces sp. TLI_185]RPF32065.1 nicotinate-nucleotide-dimethylbenzimidazole phosphoribosyltransferase /cob(II)yrinic acid a,c-diamide reductase [Streptomyces sp. TLI_185]